MKKNLFGVIIVTIILIVDFILIGYNTLLKQPKDFEVLQILSNDLYTPSYLLYSNGNGEIIDKVKLPKGEGVGYSVLRQTRNIVYFDSYPETSTILSYDNQTQSLNKVGTIAHKYERINPYSENLFIVINNGFAADGEAYNSGFCYLEDSWKCFELESNLHIWNGVVFKDKIYVYANSAQPILDENKNISGEEKILIYDKNFNLLSSIDVNEDLLLARDIIYFYPYKDNLFLLGEGLNTGEFTIKQVDENLEVKTQVNYSETNSKDRNLCTPLSFFEEEEGKLYLEISCEKSKESEGYESTRYQEDNLLLKLDFDNLGSDNTPMIEIGDSRIVGVNFETNTILTQERLDKSSLNSITVYNLDFEYQRTIEVERFDNRMPTLVDISRMKK